MCPIDLFFQVDFSLTEIRACVALFSEITAGQCEMNGRVDLIWKCSTDCCQMSSVFERSATRTWCWASVAPNYFDVCDNFHPEGEQTPPMQEYKYVAAAGAIEAASKP